MRKIFFLIPVLMFALTIKAADQYPDPSVSNSLSAAVAAVGDGETIWLDDAASYVNHYASQGGDDFTKLRGGKNITIRAIEGKHPVIKYEVAFQVREAVNAKFIGIKFDGSSLSHYDYYFYFYDNADNSLEFEDCEFTSVSKYCVFVPSGSNAASIILKNCNLHDNTNRGIINQGTIGELNIAGGKFYNFTSYPAIHNYGSGTIGKIKINGTEFYGNAKYIISGENGSHADSCIVTNCYFHDNAKSAIFFEASTTEGTETCDGVIVKNSTFANHDMSASDGSVIEVRNYNKAVAANIEVTVDHCTFYNNKTSASGYATGIRSYKSTKVNISNCIFAHPESYARCGAYCYGGNVTNCLSYNLTSGDNGYTWETTRTNNVSAAPLFTDAANADYSFSANNWVTPSLSPACGAATDGTDLGDPRWHTTAATVPSVDFASAYDLIGTKAQLTGYIRLNSSNNIEYYDNSVCGIATWRIHTTKACAVQANIDMETGSASGCNFQLEAFDKDGNKVGNATAAWQNTDDPIAMSGLIYFPAAGDYTIRLNNSASHSSAKVEKIILAYAGGAVQNLPCTTAINEAWYGNGGTRENGAISYSSWNTENSFVKWKAATTSNIFCNVILNVSVTTAHHFFVYLYEQGQEEPFATLSENYTEYGDVEDLNINLGKIYIASGKNLMIKVTNPVSGGEANVKSVQFSEVAIPTIDIPGTLNPADAMLSEKARIVNDSLLFADYGQEGYNEDQWAKWKISVSERAYYKFTLNARNSYEGNGHHYTISVLSNDESQVIATKTSAWTSAAEATAEVCAELTPGNYIVKAQNPLWGSKGRLMNIISTREGGAFTELPGQLLGNEAMLHATKLTRDANNDIVYGDNDQPRDEFVMWNVNATEAVELVVTLNLDADNTSGHNYVVELCQNGVKIDSVEEASGTNFNPGIIEITAKNLNIPAAGDYTIKLINRMKNSANILHGITFVEYVAPALIVVDENATENGNWADYYNTGNAIDLSIVRTLKGGVYNTICLPFELGSTGSMSAAFGAGYELLRLKEATLEGGVLNLIFEEKETMESGVPYLIKPVADVENPSFTGRKIKANEASTETKGDVQFIGTFIKQTIDQDEHNLYLGNDNSLYFVNNDVTIKGMRGYFHLNIQNPQQVIRRAQIVAGSQVVTSVDFVKDANNATFKTIENGQLVIIRDGIRYNVMGVKIQ